MKVLIARATIYGYDGYQVRDVIHVKDLTRLFYEFINNPRLGEV
jgi:dTDP-D-glucose 4,6-dehydratase